MRRRPSCAPAEASRHRHHRRPVREHSAVWHKEILLALEDGIAVFGASSMGRSAPRSSTPFGMVGIGAIFEAYRDGIYTDDDEVALLHGPGDDRLSRDVGGDGEHSRHGGEGGR